MKSNPFKPQAAAIVSNAKRRGTVLILAIAVLAILALLAVSYVTVVRIDRDSSDAVAVSRDFDQQVGTVVNRIQTLLTADLFGNKIVTNAVPRFTADSRSNWPSMFEDGEYADLDVIDRDYVRRWNAQPTEQNGRLLEGGQAAANRIARPDDAWLASSEPSWPSNGFGGRPFFQQFTNLRSAFEWDSEREQWVRGDGLYVDLGQWFLNPIDGRPNAGVNLLDPTGTEVTDVRTPIHSSGWEVRDRDGIDYSFQMSAINGGGDPTILQGIDERLFVDTTGDLRPDSQWTQLEELGNLFGLNWVVAARITDASALVNINTAIESPAFNLFPSASLPGGRNYSQVVSTGETPADVDLVRLLTYDYGLNLPNNVFVNGTPNLDRILGDGAAFRQHLERGIGFDSVLQNAQIEGNPTYRRALDPNFAGLGQSYLPWAGLNQPLTRNQRRYLYEVAYSRAAGGSPSAQRYPERALLDLHAFWGSNNATLISKPEQYLDGPEVNGYLPSSTNPSVNNGPLRSAEIVEPAIRTFGSGNNALPTLEQIEFDNRRLLTTVSGTGRFNPVPVINKSSIVNEFDGVFSREQHNLARPLSINVAELFGDMIWALAPFATTEELYPAMSSSARLPRGRLEDLDAEDLHYGGGVGDSVSKRFASFIQTGLPGGAGQMGAAYAIHRAGAFAVNAIDAADTDSRDALRERPTVLRFFPTVNPPTQLPILPGYSQSIADARFFHGDLLTDRSTVLRSYLGEGSGGISFIGVDRQPFLIDAHTFALYQGNEIGASVTITPGDQTNFVGSIIAFELGNPWPDPIGIGPTSGLGGGEPLGGYVIRVVRDQSWFEFELPNVIIPPGGRIVVYWSSDPEESDFDATIFGQFRSGWIDSLSDGISVDGGADSSTVVIGEGIDAIDANLNGLPSPLNPIIPFQTFATSSTGQTQVQLILKASEVDQGAGNPAGGPAAPERKGDMLVDRMTTISTSVASGEGVAALDFFGGLRQEVTETFEDAAGLPTRGNFRISVAGSMRRPVRRPPNQEGFPPYIIESPARNSMFINGPDVSPGSEENYIQRWRVARPSGGGDPTDPTDPSAGGGGGDVNDPFVGPPPSANLSARGDAFQLLNDADRAIFENLPSFQLYNPSGAFSSVSDLGLVSAFSHMYLHNQNGYPTQGYSILRVTPASTRYSLNDSPDFQYSNDTRGRWLTFGEQLGMSFHLDPIPSTAGIEPNPWFGKLDPLRYRAGGNQSLRQIPDLPQALQVPLASRVFDLFVTMDAREFLIPGVININTAPPRILSLLPLTEPLQTVQDGAGTGVSVIATPTSGAGTATSRAAKMFDYRERIRTFTGGALAVENWTQLSGLRSQPTTFWADSSRINDAARGFVTKGELPLIGQFDVNTLLPQQATAQGTFLEIGASINNAKGPPFETWSNQGVPLAFGSSPELAYGSSSFNPNGDAEEQLALFRSIANLVSTRSDVFMATFVLRGYDPDVIESIEIPGGTGSAGALQAMNDPLFRPAYESRWLVVFDRSNVRQPTDRPRILLRMELPSAVP
jgi:hypothetical protein